LNNEQTASKLLSKRVMIAGLPLRTQEFEEKRSNEQCQKCQQFGHDSRTCRNELACQICAEKHITRLHRCVKCSAIGSNCEHTILKCANCKRNHRANSKECEIYQNLISKTNQKSSTLESNIDLMSSSDIESTPTQVNKW
jgi:hypothetical protein